MAVVYSLEEQIEEIDRELRLRERVYPRWINAARPKLSPAQADKQMGRLRAARDSLIVLRDMRIGASS